MPLLGSAPPPSYTGKKGCSMGAFADGFRKWVRGMKAIRNGQRAAGDRLVQEGFDEMCAAPIADQADRGALDIMEAFEMQQAESQAS